MLLKSNVFRLVLSFCLIFCLGASAAIYADTIRLKDGSVIKGKIIGFRDGQFQIQIGDGPRARQMTFFADEIDAIEFDSDPYAGSRNSGSTNTVLPRPTNQSGSSTQRNTGANNSGGYSTDSSTTGSVNPTAKVTRPNTGGIQPKIIPTNSPRPKPIQLNLKVLADNTANGWTNAGWVVKKGQKIRITGTGRISLGSGNYSTPAGIGSIADKDKLMQNQATGGLIAVIGDDNNDFVFIGGSREFTASRDGALFLGINEGNLDDNSGSFDVVIEIEPEI
jgi:hypothetical protein